MSANGPIQEPPRGGVGHFKGRRKGRRGRPDLKVLPEDVHIGKPAAVSSNPEAGTAPPEVNSRLSRCRVFPALWGFSCFALWRDHCSGVWWEVDSRTGRYALYYPAVARIPHHRTREKSCMLMALFMHVMGCKMIEETWDVIVVVFCYCCCAGHGFFKFVICFFIFLFLVCLFV